MASKKKPKLVQLKIRLPEDLLEKVDQLAAASMRTRSAVIRDALEALMSQKKIVS